MTTLIDLSRTLDPANRELVPRRTRHWRPCSRPRSTTCTPAAKGGTG
ncbi:hypothetical protein [Aeromicrobium sp. UC242_57]